MSHPSSARPLQGRTAPVTGVSRRRGIGYAVAVELAALGASVFVHHYGPHEVEQPWGGDDLEAFRDTSTRSTLLLTRHVAHRHAATTPGPAPARPGDRIGPVDERRAGRAFWTTSGQGEGPMRGEVAYATSKAALAGVTPTVAAELLELGIVLNTVDPGPVNTGCPDPGTTDRSLEELEARRQATPFGRWGHPTDPARLFGWPATDQGVWIAGQVITTDGVRA